MASSIPKYIWCFGMCFSGNLKSHGVQVKGAECVVMAGDPCQLPPTVLSPPTSEAAQELQYTLYARLADAGRADCTVWLHMPQFVLKF